MRPLDRMRALFRGDRPDRPVAVVHWWGSYKFEFASKYGIDSVGTSLADVDSFFYDAMQPGWIHLGSGAPRDGWTDVNAATREELLPAVQKLDSEQAIDDFVAAHAITADDVLESGVYEHVGTMSERYGDEALIVVNEGNPVCQVFDPFGILGFESGLIALMEKPHMVARLIDGLYVARRPWVEALATLGCHAYLGSETYVAADTISPECFRGVVLPALTSFYSHVRRTGLHPLVYFLGDLNPLIPDLNTLDVDALLVEESKKGFVIDVGRIRSRLDRRIVLFGNVDSISGLLLGSREDIIREARRQIEAAGDGPFVTANGSPIAPGTSPIKLRALLDGGSRLYGKTTVTR